MKFDFNGKLTVKWAPEVDGGVNEIYSQGWQCAFLGVDSQQAHSMCYSNDFLQGVARAHIHGGTAAIYGFSYSANKNPRLNLSIERSKAKVVKGNKKPKEVEEVKVKVSGRTEIIAANSKDKNFLKLQPAVADLLHQIETHLGLDLTQIHLVENPADKYNESGAVVYVGSSRWMEAPPLLSLYTLLLRLGCVHKVGDKWLTTLENVASGKVAPYQVNDGHYTKASLEKIKEIMKIGYRAFFYIDPAKNYPSGVDISNLHNSAGIVALAIGKTEKVVPFWSREKLKNKPTLEQRRAKSLNEAAVVG
jgi:hypothetical protein